VNEDNFKAIAVQIIAPGSEAWAVSKINGKRIETAEIKFMCSRIYKKRLNSIYTNRRFLIFMTVGNGTESVLAFDSGTKI
jgi:hypothetical protein